MISRTPKAPWRPCWEPANDPAQPPHHVFGCGERDRNKRGLWGPSPARERPGRGDHDNPGADPAASSPRSRRASAPPAEELPVLADRASHPGSGKFRAERRYHSHRGQRTNDPNFKDGHGALRRPGGRARRWRRRRGNEPEMTWETWPPPPAAAQGPEAPFGNFTDSRTVHAGQAFWALRGERRRPSIPDDGCGPRGWIVARDDRPHPDGCPPISWIPDT